MDKLSRRVIHLNEQNLQLRSQLEAQAIDVYAQTHSFEFEGEKALDKEINDTLIENGLPNDFPHLTNGNHNDSANLVKKLNHD